MSSPNASANTNTNDVDAGRTPRELRLENLRQVRRQRRQLELDRQPTRNQRPRETPPAAAAAPNGGGGGDGNGGAEAAPPPFVASGEGADSNPNGGTGGTGGTGGLEADSNPNGGTGGEDAAAGHAVVQAGGGWGVWPMLQSLLLSFVPGLGGDGGAAAAANAAAEAARDNREILGIVSGTQASIIGNVVRLTANVGGVTSSLETETEARQREAAGLRLMVEALQPRTDRHLATAAGQDGGAAAAAGGGGEAQVRAMISTARAEDSEIYWEVIDDFHRLFKEVFGLIKALQATVAGQGAIIRALQEQLAELQGNGGAEGAEEEEEG